MSVQVSTSIDDSRFCSRCRAAYPQEFDVCPRDGAPLVAGNDPLVGTELRDTYRITHVIGEGALGRVYHAEHVRFTRSYAVKVPRGMWVDHPKSRLRFFNEATAAGRLAHPNIAAVVDYGETAAQVPYLVMELAAGAPLTDTIARGPLASEEALAIARQIAAGLAHAHEQGIVHRDLKPDNVMVCDGRARIVDFGIALVTELGDEGRFTTQGFVVGTPAYMAPEQLLGEPIDCRTDLFALGAILYEMVCGLKPYDGTTLEYVHHTVRGKLPSFAVRAPWLAIDHRIDELCQQLMARAPGDRPADAATVIRAIDAILDAPPPERSSRLPVRARGSLAPVNVSVEPEEVRGASPERERAELARADTVQTDRIDRRSRWWHALWFWKKRDSR